MLPVFPALFRLHDPWGILEGLQPTEPNLPLRVTKRTRLVQGAVQDRQILALDLDCPSPLHLQWEDGLQPVQSHALWFGGLFLTGSVQ